MLHWLGAQDGSADVPADGKEFVHLVGVVRDVDVGSARPWVVEKPSVISGISPRIDMAEKRPVAKPDRLRQGSRRVEAEIPLYDMLRNFTLRGAGVDGLGRLVPGIEMIGLSPPPMSPFSSASTM